MNNALHAERRGMENSVLIKSGRTIVAEVFTHKEPSDQYETGALFAAAPDMLAALRAAETFMMDQPVTLCLINTLATVRAALARATGADQ